MRRSLKFLLISGKIHVFQRQIVQSAHINGLYTQLPGRLIYTLILQCQWILSILWKRKRNPTQLFGKDFLLYEIQILSSCLLEVGLVDCLIHIRQLPEKMCLGALLLEPINKEFWVILGCLSSNHALKQHSFIRGLQLDISLSEAWAYLGKVFG